MLLFANFHTSITHYHCHTSITLHRCHIFVLLSIAVILFSQTSDSVLFVCVCFIGILTFLQENSGCKSYLEFELVVVIYIQHIVLLPSTEHQKVRDIVGCECSVNCFYLGCG